MKKLRILFISEFFPPYVKGGADLSTSLLVNELSRNCECFVATSNFKEFHTAKTNYSVYPILKRCDFNGNILMKLNYALNLLISPIYNYYKIKKLLKKNKVDIIQIVPTHFTYFSLIYLLAKLNKPIFIDIRDYSFKAPFGVDKEGNPKTILERSQTKKSFISKIFFLFCGNYEYLLFTRNKNLMMSLLKKDNLISFVSVSDYVKRQLIEEGIPKNRVYTIKNISKQMNISKNKKQNSIVFAGRLEKDKGIWDAIKAFELINDKNLVFDIIGEGLELEKIKDYIHRNKIHKVHILGKLKHKEVLEIYSKSKIIISPSIWPEPFGRFILESIATRTPLISTNTGGTSEGIKHRKTGLLVDPNNPKQLAKAIKELLTNKKLYNKIVKNLEKEAWKYSPERIGKQRLALYKKVISDNKDLTYNRGSEIFK